MTEKITFFRSYFEALKDLPPEEYKESMNAILEYAFDEREPENLSPIANAVFCLARPNIDKSLSRSEAGHKGGQVKQQANAKQSASKPETNTKQTLSKDESNGKQTVSKTEANRKNVQAIKDIGVRSKEKGIKESKEKTKRRFVPPTHADLIAYSQEIGFTNFDADRFLDYYTANGWMVGRQHMKDWKAAVRNWKRQDDGESFSHQRNGQSVRMPDYYGRKPEEHQASTETISEIKAMQEAMKGQA